MKYLRLDYFLMLGVELEVGDIYINTGGKTCLIEDAIEAGEISKPTRGDKFRSVKSFAPRKNKGVQPVPDDFPVMLVNSEGWDFKALAGSSDVEWSNACEIKIKSWKPDLEKLIEQQAQYDFEQGKALSPQVEAGIEQIAKQLKGKEMNVYTQEMRDGGELPTSGMKCKVKNVWLFVGVKSNGLWVMERESDKDLHSFHPTEIKPYKSQEEIELEESRFKQCDTVGNFIFNNAPVKMRKNDCIELAKLLQDAGHLSETK